MEKTLDWLKRQLAQPSTWRGVLALLTSFGIAISPQQAEAITAAGLALIGLVGVFTKDPGTPPREPNNAGK